MESALPFASYLHSLPAEDPLSSLGLILPFAMSIIAALVIAAFVALFAPIRGR